MRLSSKSSPSHPFCQARKPRLPHSLELRHNLKFRHNLNLRSRRNLRLRSNPDTKWPSLPLHTNHSNSNSLKSSNSKPPTNPNNSNHTNPPNHRDLAISSISATQEVPHRSNLCSNNNTHHL
jgi:hypothetical protein